MKLHLKNLKKTVLIRILFAGLLLSPAAQAAGVIPPDCLVQVSVYGDGVKPRDISPGCLSAFEASALPAQKVQIESTLWIGTGTVLFRKTTLPDQPLYEIIAGSSTQLKRISSIELSPDGTQVQVIDSGRLIVFDSQRFGNVAPTLVTPLSSSPQ